MGARICAGLAYLHGLKDAEGRPLGVVHRDVSPQNVVACADGAIKLLDLGIAQLAGAPAGKEPGLIRGRPPYLSPEQCLAKPLDGRSDLFSLGAVLWELVARRRLVTGEDLLQVANTITTVRAPHLRTVEPGFPETLAEAVDRALELEPRDRFANAAEMGRAFEEFLPQARQEPPPLPQALPATRRTTKRSLPWSSRPWPTSSDGAPRPRPPPRSWSWTSTRSGCLASAAGHAVHPGGRRRDADRQAAAPRRGRRRPHPRRGGVEGEQARRRDRRRRRRARAPRRGRGVGSSASPGPRRRTTCPSSTTGSGASRLDDRLGPRLAVAAAPALRTARTSPAPR